MKKGTIIGIGVIVAIIIVASISYVTEMRRRDELNAMLNETYDNAISAGGELLKTKYPDLFNDETDFIGYELNGIWHVQSYTKSDKNNPSINYGEKFANIENIRYVKFKDENFDEVLMFGDFETGNKDVDSKFEIRSFDDTHFILRQISAFKFGEELSGHYSKGVADGTYRFSGFQYIINIRYKDGMILYLGSNAG